MKFIDAPLARRLEASEDEAQLAVAAVLQKTQSEIGAAVLTIGDGHAAFAGKNSPVGRTIGFGFTGPVSATDIDKVEAFYAAHDALAQFDVTPLQHESLTALLHERGYSMSELNNVMARRINPEEIWNEQLDGLEFRDCSSTEAALWTNTMLRGFFADSAIPEGWDKLLMPMAIASISLPMIVWDGDQPAAAAGGILCRDWNLMMLGGTSTLKEYRGRGIQTAAIGRRLAMAARAGCDLAVVVTRGGTTSQRNAERMGFTLAYSKATLVQRK